MGKRPKIQEKTLKRFSVIWNIVSIATMILGFVTGPDKNDGKVYVNLPLVLIGIGMCIIGNFIIAITMLVTVVKEAKAYNQYLEENEIDEKEEEAAFKTYINNTTHNQEATSFRELSMWLRAMKNAPKEKSVRSYVNLVLVILFAGCCLTFVPLLCAGQMIAGLAVFGAAFACIFLLLIIHLVHKKISNNPRNIDQNLAPQCATVQSCTISDESSYGWGSKNYYHQTNRILSTTYLICLDVNGEQKKAYSKTFYNKGEKVYVYQNKKLKDMVIIKEAE